MKEPSETPENDNKSHSDEMKDAIADVADDLQPWQAQALILWCGGNLQQKQIAESEGVNKSLRSVNRFLCTARALNIARKIRSLRFGV